MDTVADYEAWKAKQRKSGVGAAAMVLGSVDTAPDQLAGDLQLATEFGKVTGNPVPPAPMVQEYRSVFQQAIEKTRAETILSSSPRLTEWLRNPENATLARDDLEGLSWWETGLGAVGNSVKRAALSVPQTYNQAMAGKFAGDAADLQRGFGDLVYDEREPVFKDGKEVARLWATPTDVLGAAWRWGTSRWSGLVTDPAADAAAYQMRAAELQGRIAGMAMSPGAQAIREKLGTVTGTWQEQLSQFGALIAEDPLGFASFIGQVGLESAPAIGLSTAVGVATRSPTAAAATMGALSGAREYGASAGDVVAQSGYDLSTFEGAMAAISDEDLMRRAGETGQTRAIIIGALDGISGGVAGKVLSESPVGNMLLQTVTQALFGSGGEAAATYAAGQEFNLANVLIEGIAEAFTAPIEVGGMAVAKVRQMQAQARDAEGRVALFQELSGQAVASKLRARMPDRFRQFVDQATANGPVENVFVPAQDFVQYFQTAGIDPYALVDELDGVSRDDLDAALAGGGDLKIPTATYAAKIAGSEHDAFLMENMRFDPLDMTAKEAADFNARVDDVMQEMWAEAEDIRQDEERWRAVEEKIHDTVVSQMRAAGLSTERAMAEVQPIVAFYRTRAARMGLTTEEYLARHPLPGIQGAIPQGMQFKNVDELNRTLAEARNRRAPAVDTRQSLLEFIDGYGGINDVGGELKARDAVAVKRRGKSTLKLAREGAAGQGSMLGPNVGGKRFGADDVAQAAIEAGFMADNPLVMEYRAAMADGRETPDLTAALWDAIDAELAGQKQASVQDAAPVDDAYLDEIEGYLNRLGLDMSNTDEEIRAAIEADQAGGRMYGQDAEVKTAADVGSGPTEAMENVILSLGGEVVSRSYDASGFGDMVVLRLNGTDLQISVREDGLGIYLTSIASKKAGDLTEKRAGSGVGSAAINALKAYADKTGKPFAVAGATEPARGFYEKMGMVPADVTLFMDDGYMTSPASGEGGGGFVYRPAGASQIATDSAAFKAWFGDSVVVNEDGSPKVVYHGTDRQFAAFNADAPSATGVTTRAFFFTESQGVADGYGDNVMPVYLNIEAPVELDFAGKSRVFFDGEMRSPSELAARISEIAKDVERGALDPDSDLRYDLQDAGWDYLANDKIDGLIVKNVDDSMSMFGGEVTTHYVAFTPTQIKSVNNRGTFDPNDARILYQDGDTPLNRLLSGVRERLAQRSQIADQIAAAGKPVRMSNGELNVMVGPNTIAGEKPFRVTYMGADGKPNGHVEAATLREAAVRAMEDGFMPAGRSYNQDAAATDQPLYVVHNLSAEKLRHAADLGGLAAPSLAVARGDIGFDAFGEISLIGDPSLANPKTKGVRLFSADVYSPRQPRARFKIDGKAARAMRDALRPVAERLGLDVDRALPADTEIERDGLSAVEAGAAVKAAWLESLGEAVPVVREAPAPQPVPVPGFEAFTSTDWYDLQKNPAFEDAVAASRRKMAEDRRATNPALADKILEKAFDADGRVDLDVLTGVARDVAMRNRSIRDYVPSSSGLVDRFETSRALEKALAGREAEFNGWVRDQFGGVIGAAFFETEAGRKKDYTLTNLVREMTRVIRNGESWNYGAGNVRASVAPEFKSLAEVKAARGQITDDAAIDVLKDEVNNELFALGDKFKPYHRSGDSFGWGDIFSEFLKDVAKGPRAVNEWQSGIFSQPAPDELINEARAFLEKLKTLPTNYFEIKMQRAMDFSEFTAALVPEGLAADARKILTDAGLELIEYKRGDDKGAARNAALQQIGSRVFFQRDAGPRGSFSPDLNVIRLFETANLSTLQHEMGHLFLTMLQRDAADGDAATVAEYENVKSWWRGNAAAVAADGNRAMPDAKITAADVMLALDGGTTGDIIKDAAIDVGMQEQWARGYEAYLMEGKAPSVELRSVFAKFRSWMISVYKSLTGLNVKITPEIRAVFDRMLATDEEIAKAQASSGETRGLFTTAEQMGLTEEEFARFVKLRVQAEDEAKARLQVEIMEPIRRETEKWWKDERARVTEETERRINAMPVFRAMEWLGNRRWLGDGQPEAMPDMRMSKSVLVDRYGDGVLKTLPRGMQTVYAVEGGMDPDDVAGWFGFGSGDEMIRAMERAPKRGDAIKAEVDAEMYRRHGDPLKDGEIERRALDALHSDRRGEWLAAELKAVAEVAGVAVPITSKEARASAKVAVARMKVRDAVAANRFLAAERKAGEEAARLAMMLGREGVWMQNARRRIATKTRAALREDATVDAVAGQIEQANKSTGNYNDTVQRLIEAKRRQLVNHALFMEARSVAEEVEKAERFVQKLNKATMRERIAGAGRREGAQTDYLAALDEIQDRYDFRKMSGRAEERRGALVAFVDAMKAAGRENELAVPEAVLRAANRTPYKTLTVEELRGVVDSLKNIQHIALRWNDLIDAQNQRKLDEAVAEITEAMDANLPKRPPGRVKTAGEGFRNSARQFIDLVLNASTLLREIDGFKDAGAAYRNLKAPIDEAMDRLTVRKEKAAAEMEALYAVYSKEDRRRMAVREYVPALGYSLSKWEKIAVALNTGNEGNMQRLTDPKVRGSLTEAQVRAVLASLDERDAGFIQSVWDFVGSFRDDIAERERRTTGVEPAWVDASPVQIGGKELRGGYYPLKYDPRLSSLARDDEAQAIGEALQAGRFGKAQTKRGHLEARAKSSGRDVELDMSVFHRHVNQVIYDLELSEPVANSWKVLQSGDVRQAFMDAGRQADFDALETWLKDVAEGQLAAGDWINKNARRFKSNFTAAKLAFNLGTVAAQVTGLSQTIVVVGKRDFLLGLQASFRAGIGDEIAAKSPFMRQRQTTFNKDVMDFYDDPSLGPTASRWGEIKREWIGPASFWLMTKVQWLLVDIPTWLGGYQQGLRLYANDEAKAVAHADGIVKRAQSSGLFSDRSAIERGSVSRTTRQNDVVRLFTTLGSYMFAKFNVAYERAAVGGRVIRKEGLSLRSVQEAASLTLDMAFLFTLEAVVMAAIKGRLPDDEDEEDAGWAAFLAKETAFSVLGTIPFVRDVASFGQGFEGGGAYGGIISELGKPFIEISQGEIDKGLLKSVISTTGLFTGLPASQINRAVDAAWRQAEGDDVAPVEYLLGKR